MTQYDIIFVLPYHHSDHPSFPEGILKRTLEAHGFSVGMIERPFWQEPGSFSVLGEPRLFFGIVPGPVDSIVLNYTSARKRRNEDLYQGDGQAFFQGYPPSIKYKIRPDRTVVVFANRIRQAFKKVPIVIGGIEASLRRFAHFDFQEEKIKRSILLDSRADLLVTGMGETQIVRIAQTAQQGLLSARTPGMPVKEIDIPGTTRMTRDISEYGDYVILPTMEEILNEKTKLVEASKLMEQANISGKGAIQPHEGRYVIQHPDQSYTAEDIDRIYSYPYTRLHPGLPIKQISASLRMNLFSVTSHRGCGGGCAFCSITAHEGKRILSRSVDSILEEIGNFNAHPHWKGVVSDIGGATAELFGSDCDNMACKRTSCFVKQTCKTIGKTDNYLSLLREARKLEGVRNVFLGSGIRYDLMLQNPELLEEILTFHCGKFLRIAPEHSETPVLNLMRKPDFELFIEFVELFHKINDKLKRKIELAPYIIVGHPGESLQDVIKMRNRFKRLKLKTTDAQIFTPTPGTISTAMYYAGVSTRMEPIPVERSIRELMKRKRILAQK